jgi:glucosamine kinase
MQTNIKYFIGVDGGGSGTRVVVTDLNRQVIAEAEGAPSALGQGIEQAWRSIMDTIALALATEKLKVPMLSECAIGLGLSGANNIIWKNEFLLRNPGFKNISLDTDGFTTLLGAHDGLPGVIVAVGTGSVGMVLKNTGERIAVSGWGFPAGDEASGAWLGMKAASLAQKTLDGRRPPSALTNLILDFCGSTTDEFLTWLGNAKQNAFAQLAPFIFATAETDASAKGLLIEAGIEIEIMIKTLDPKGELQLSICGRLGEALIPFLPDPMRIRAMKAKNNSAVGALYLVFPK